VVGQWLTQYVTSWKVIGSRPDEVNDFYQFNSSFWLCYALGFTHPVTEISTRGWKIMFLGSKAVAST
jgi:hypothetical protein